jgi:hypothetical protein
VQGPSCFLRFFILRVNSVQWSPFMHLPINT